MAEHRKVHPTYSKYKLGNRLTPLAYYPHHSQLHEHAERNAQSQEQGSPLPPGPHPPAHHHTPSPARETVAIASRVATLMARRELGLLHIPCPLLDRDSVETDCTPRQAAVLGGLEPLPPQTRNSPDAAGVREEEQSPAGTQSALSLLRGV